MIYTRWGTSVEIVGHCGVCKPEWAEPDQVFTLLKCRTSEGREQFEFAHTLRADDGWKEIDAAAKLADRISLNETESEAAIRDAE